jgi:hypothetical protein
LAPTSRQEMLEPLYRLRLAPVRLMLLLGDSPLISSTSTTRAIFSEVLVALAVMVTPRQPAGVKTEAVYLISMVMVFDGFKRLTYALPTFRLLCGENDCFSFNLKLDFSGKQFSGY